MSEINLPQKYVRFREVVVVVFSLGSISVDQSEAYLDERVAALKPSRYLVRNRFLVISFAHLFHPFSISPNAVSPTVDEKYLI